MPRLARAATGLALTVALLAGCAAGSTPLPEATPLQPADRTARTEAVRLREPAPVPVGYQVVAERGHLRLMMTPEGRALIVEDRRSGMLWRSVPADADQQPVRGLWQRILTTSVKVGTTDTRIKANVRPGAPDALRMEPIPDGARVHYTLSDLEISFAMEFTLTDDSLRVRIPEESIREGEEHMLVYIEPLPFLGAAGDEVDGYLLVPDGAGALMRFDPDRVDRSRGFEEWVYTADHTLAQVPLNRRPVVLPVFGLKRDRSAFVAYITEGDHNARISGLPAGNVVNYNRISAQLWYRNEFRARVTDLKDVIQITTYRVKGDRSLTYTFLDGEDADYSGMARTYRDYLLYAKGVPRRPLEGGYPLSLRLFMGALEDGLVSDRLRVVTTFEQARSVAEAFRSEGVDRVELTLVGWTRKGYHGDLPGRFPADAAFGGNRGLEELAVWARDAGIPLYLQDNFQEAYKTEAGFTPRAMAVESPIGIVVEKRTPRLSLPTLPSDAPPYWLINPRYAAERYFAPALERLSRMGVPGLELEMVGEGLYSDYEAKRLMDRSDTQAMYVRMLDAARQRLGSVSVLQGNAYVLGYVDRITDLPLASSQFVSCDEEVPFVPMVLHGVVPYTGSPGNLRENPRLEFLRQVEYGAIPAWELTHDLPAALRSTVYKGLYSARYDHWLQAAADEYRELNAKAGEMAGLLMEEHRYLAPGVAQVTFEDGAALVVNYTEEPFAVDGVTVPPLDFAVIKGGEGR